MEAPSGREEEQPLAVREGLQSKNKPPKPPPESVAGAQGTQATGRMRSAHTSWGSERAAKVQGLQGRGRHRD